MKRHLFNHIHIKQNIMLICCIVYNVNVIIARTVSTYIAGIIVIKRAELDNTLHSGGCVLLVALLFKK